MAKNKEIVEEKIEEKILDIPLEQAVHDYMMPYAEDIILNRALPRVEDGLKPVQRRILYTMHELNMKPEGQYKKSARVVGDCLGKYHPHGDSSVYDAMVNLAQDFRMRNVLIDGNGNFGSIDGDSAAAMRYTEVKMAPLAVELLRDIDKETVPWVKNFDDSLDEPDLLPGRFPNILVNGSMGIAIGLATKIPPHNLTEVIDGCVAYIDNPKITIDEMLTIIKGPDFPTGGFVTESDSFKDIYTTGRGKAIMRAKVDIENDNGKQNIIIHEIPFDVNKSKLQIDIKELREKQIQKDGKKCLLGGIQEIVDESDRNGIRIAIKLKKGEDATKILDYLYKKTDLQCNLNYNMMVIAEGRPQQLGLIPIIKYYLAHQREVIKNRSQFDLNNAKKREHILEGFVLILGDIDNVVKIIKESKGRSDAKDRLRQAYMLSEKQADAILDLKLVSLTKLEVTKIEDELAEIKKTVAKLEKIVNSKTEQMRVVREELIEIRNKYRCKRLTTVVGGLEDIEHTALDAKNASDKRGYILSDADCNLKLIGKVQFLNATGRVKPTEKSQIVREHIFVDSGMQPFVFTNKGNCIKLDMNNIDEARTGDDGYKLSKVCPEAAPDEKCVKLYILSEKDEEKEIYFFTKNGLVKRTQVSEYLINKRYYEAVSLNEGDELIAVEVRQPDTNIIMISDDGYVLNVSHDEFKNTGRRTAGVIGMQLNPGASLMYAGQIELDTFENLPIGEIIFITKSGYAKRVYAADADLSKRARKGTCFIDLAPSDMLFTGTVTNAYDIALLDEKGVVNCINTEDIQIIRNSRKKGKACAIALNCVLATKQNSDA